MGLRRIGDVARLSVVSALIGTAAEVSSLLIWGEAGLLLYIITTPIATFLIGWYFTARLPKSSGQLRASQLFRNGA